ncbi:MAG: hypothetical protein SCK57_13920, partial [Bacillota bacterium]|nr:hypothetical protein [Bacillota bacterium]
EAQVDRLRRLLHHSQSAQAAHQRLAELEERRTALKTTLEEQVAFLSALEAYTRAQAELLQEKVNHHFGLARFRLFRPLVNGELEECCEILCDGVPFKDNLNGGSRLQVGLDIIRTLSRHYGVTLPILIENRESYVTLPPMDTQVISLVVSAPDAVLRIAPDPQQPLNDSQAPSEPSEPPSAPTPFPEGQNAGKTPLTAPDTPGENRLHGPGF